METAKQILIFPGALGCAEMAFDTQQCARTRTAHRKRSSGKNTGAGESLMDARADYGGKPQRDEGADTGDRGRGSAGMHHGRDKEGAQITLTVLGCVYEGNCSQPLQF